MAMRGKNKPRANVRLRLDKGTLLIKQFGMTSVTCVIVDLSESGCQCRLELTDLDPATAMAWKTILMPGRVLSVELSEPPELQGLTIKEAEVRWVRPGRSDSELDFGFNLANLDPQQKQVLGEAMLNIAAEKLRAKKAAEESKRSGRYAAQRAQNVEAGDPPAPVTSTQASLIPRESLTPHDSPAPREREPLTAREPLAPRESFSPRERDTASSAFRPHDSGEMRSTGPKPMEPRHEPRESRPPSRQFHASPSASTASDTTFQRQKRHRLIVPVTYRFRDSSGNVLDAEQFKGHTLNFNEGGFQIEGPGSSYCLPDTVVARSVYVDATFSTQPTEITAGCRIRSADPSPDVRNYWIFGLQLIEISEADKRLIREMYIRAGLTMIIKKR